MTKLNLNKGVRKRLRLLNNREKCEFLAHFPTDGITQKQLAGAGVFSQNRSVVHYHLRPYRGGFLQVAEKADVEGFKPMFLTLKGEDLQKVARYMILVNEELNGRADQKIDYLCMFLEKGDPGKLIEVFDKVYNNGVSKVVDFHRFSRDRAVDKMVGRLEEFGLVDVVMMDETDRNRRYVDRTERGELVFDFLVLQVVNHLNNKKNSEVIGYLTQSNRWENYVADHGNGWLEKVTNP